MCIYILKKLRHHFTLNLVKCSFYYQVWVFDNVKESGNQWKSNAHTHTFTYVCVCVVLDNIENNFGSSL